MSPAGAASPLSSSARRKKLALDQEKYRKARTGGASSAVFRPRSLYTLAPMESEDEGSEGEEAASRTQRLAGAAAKRVAAKVALSAARVILWPVITAVGLLLLKVLLILFVVLLVVVAILGAVSRLPFGDKLIKWALE